MTAKNTTPTPADLFADTDVPAAAARPTLPNPFVAVVASMTVGGKAKTGAVPYLDSDDETAKRAEARADRQLTEAGDKAGVTVRRTFEYDENAGTHRVTFWVVKKINRKAKDTADTNNEQPAPTA